MSKWIIAAQQFVGKASGRLTVTAVSSERRNHAICLDCKCSCGSECTVLKVQFSKGLVKSCGCLKKEIFTKGGGPRKHGHTGKGWWSPEYQAWQHMKRRCYNPRVPGYKNYGGRGIAVCDEWREKGGFEKFLAHVGPKPHPDLSIDRINVDGNYEPGNVRWATAKEQMNNTRRNKHYKPSIPATASPGVDLPSSTTPASK